MKELTIEEKAKCYDIALNKIKMLLGTGSSCSREELEYVFPELAEPDDERIRKQLLEMVHDFTGDSLWVDYNIHKEDAIAWLEKKCEQKQELLTKEKALKNSPFVEQKPAWSEEDDVAVKDIYDKLNRLSMTYIGNQSIVCQEDIKWLKSLKDRVQPQSKQEWSEEDEKDFNTAIQHIENYVNNTPSSQRPEIWADITKLKSLRPQSQWKPGIEQLNALSIVSKGNAPDDIEAIVSLYNDLKKLREEWL